VTPAGFLASQHRKIFEHLVLPITRLLLHPALEHPDIAHIGAEHDVESVARDRHNADRAIQRDVRQHPRRDVPGRAERAGLAPATAKSQS
jgi:hypothetical protein